MFNILKYILFSIIVITFISCGKDDVVKKIEKKVQTEYAEDDDMDTTALTPQEAFSNALVNNILNTDDEDLQIYLEDEIYPIVSKSNKTTIDKISSSLILLQYEESGNTKNILIQKFYNPVKDEFFFEKREVQSDAIKQFLK
ncbi:MAG: hypothetical protein WC358_11750 [Ignavibacteria bacterium]|jgi:hypothetical protein